MLGVAVGLVAIGVSGRPAPTIVGRSPGAVPSTVTAVPSTAPPVASEPGRDPAGRYVVLTSPSRDDSIVEVGSRSWASSADPNMTSRSPSSTAGSGFATGPSLPRRSRGDPAWQARAWFETETPTGDLPIGRSLRLVVDLRAPDGSTIETIERSVRVGPIIEPDSRGSTGVLPRVIRSDPTTLGEDGVMGALTLDAFGTSD